MTVSVPPLPRAPVPVSPSQIPNKLPKLHVVRYVTLPYEVGKTLKIQMFVDNLGDLPLKLVGGTRTELVEKFPRDPAERGKLEQPLWAGTAASSIPSNLVTVVPVQPPGGFFVQLESDRELTQPDIDKLSTSGTMYVMTIYKDEKSRIRIEPCIHTVPSRDSVLYCVDPLHNFDEVNPRPRTTRRP